MLPTAYGEPTAIVPHGLATAEARRRLGEYGANTVIEKSSPRWQIFLAKFWSPIAWMLEAAIILQLWVTQYIEAGVIGGLLHFNATLGFIQEGRARQRLPHSKSGSRQPLSFGGSS